MVEWEYHHFAIFRELIGQDQGSTASKGKKRVEKSDVVCLPVKESNSTSHLGKRIKPRSDQSSGSRHRKERAKA